MGRDCAAPHHPVHCPLGKCQLQITYALWYYARLPVPTTFTSPVDIDLSSNDYIVVVEQSPNVVPNFATYERKAGHGTGPYTYATSDSTVAVVDDGGTVTLRGNGSCTVTAVDSKGASAEYKLTVCGIRSVHFLSHSADWQGMQALCAAARLKPVTLNDVKRLWLVYFPSSGPVANHLGWLHYPVWTGDALGAGTAWAYDLNGTSVNDNASACNKDTFCQVLGISE
jgi:hypothetical protein